MADLSYDTAMCIDIGRRDRQEDALASDFPSGQAFGFVVLADGMGGHAAGDIASKIVVTEFFSELKLQSGDPALLEPCMSETLKAMAFNANMCLGHYASEHAQTDGMGSTLLAPVIVEDRLYWISVGDSPLYLFRKDTLTRLNENHALSSQIDYLVSSGIMDREEANNYPDQSCLTSVLVGGDIAQLDCPATPLMLEEGDILIAASDGLQFISEEQIENVLRFQRKSTAEQISGALKNEIQKLDDPHQDNLSICVIKLLRKGSEPVQEDVVANYSDPDGKKFETITIMARVKRGKKMSAQS